MTRLLLAVSIAFVASLAIVRILATDRLARLVLDTPNARSLHVVPVPRTGGIGLMAGLAVGWLAAAIAGLPVVTGLAAITALLALFFFFDDLKGLPVRLRLALQAAAAAAFLYVYGVMPLWLLPVLLMGMIWSCNLYNFMDGSNGMAGGMAVIGFAACAIGAWVQGDAELATAAALVSAAAAGFLVWNRDPARIFLGDAGSIPLGFLAAAIGVLGWQRGLWPFWFPALVFAVFILDSGVTLVRRALRGEQLSEAHRNHYYQRLIRSGWSHGKLALAAWIVMIATGASAIALLGAHPLVVANLLALWLALFAGFALLIDRRWRQHEARELGKARPPTAA